MSFWAPANIQASSIEMEWGTEIAIGGGNASSPQMAMNADGNAIAVWYQDDVDGRNIYARHYMNGSWGGSEIISSVSTGGLPQVVMDADGNAIVVWAAVDGVHQKTYKEGSWGSDLVIGAEGNMVSWLRVAMDDEGDAIVVWTRTMSNNTTIWASAFIGGVWIYDDIVASENGYVSDPNVAIDGGSAMVVWRQYGQEYNDVYANTYQNGSWSNATLIEEGDNYAGYPDVAMVGGYAIATWLQVDDDHETYLYTNTYQNGSWGTGEIIAQGGSDGAQISMLENGDAMVVWSRTNGSSRDLHSIECINGEWGADVIIGNGGEIRSYDMAMNNHGDVIVIWAQDDDSHFDIYANVHSDGSWDGEDPIGNGDGDSLYPQVAIDLEGNGVAVWLQQGVSNGSILSNEYASTSDENADSGLIFLSLMLLMVVAIVIAVALIRRSKTGNGDD